MLKLYRRGRHDQNTQKTIKHKVPPVIHPSLTPTNSLEDPWIAIDPTWHALAFTAKKKQRETVPRGNGWSRWARTAVIYPCRHEHGQGASHLLSIPALHANGFFPRHAQSVTVDSYRRTFLFFPRKNIPISKNFICILNKTTTTTKNQSCMNPRLLSGSIDWLIDWLID